MNSSNDMENIEAIHELTGTQLGILYQCLLSETSAVYQNQLRLNITGIFDPKLFTQSINDVIARHQPLRSLFLQEGLDVPATVVLKTAQIPVQYLKMPGASHSVLQQIASQKACSKLALDEAPLMRLTSIEIGKEAFFLILDFHHIIFDGWSNVIFFNEVKSYYQAKLRDQPAHLPKPSQFSDYVNQLVSSDQSASADYWHNKLNGLIEPTPLPMSISMLTENIDSNHANAHYEHHLDHTLSLKLREAAKTHRVTLNSLIAAAWGLTLSRYSDSEDIVFGVTVNGRTNVIAEHEQTVGLFVNTLPLRLTINKTLQLSELVSHVQQEIGEITQHEQMPLSAIHKQSQLQPGTELFETLLVFQSFPVFDNHTKTPHATDLPWQYQSVKVHENSPLPLTIEVFDHDNISLLALFNESRLVPASVQQLIKHLLSMLHQFADTTVHDWPIDQIPMLSLDEAQIESVDYRDGFIASDLPATLVDAFREQVRKTPCATAISDTNKSVTYTELANLTTRTASHLTDLDIKAGDRVLVFTHRGVNIYPAILGTMQIGALFVPMDPHWPVARVTALAKDCNAKLILVDDSTHPICDVIDVPKVRIKSLLEPHMGVAQNPNTAATQIDNHIQDTDHAYILYTSGSTGSPKGVVGKHSATLNRFSWMWKHYPFIDTDRCVQKTSLCFVDAIWEMFGPLLKGVPTHILDEHVVNTPSKLLDQLQANKTTHLVMVPSLLSVLLDEFENIEQRLIHLRLCTVSGEVLPSSVAQLFLRKLPNVSLLNLYGSTEVTADVCWSEIKTQKHIHTGNIGRPIQGVAAHVLSNSLKPMPPGAIGELCISGKAISAGYVNQHQQPSDAFVSNPFSDGLLFKTGDLASRNPNGSITLHGRKDQVVKLNGVRIDLLDISNTLMQHAGVSYAVAQITDTKNIACWYRPAEGKQISSNNLLDYLSATLPTQMVPSNLVKVDEFPRLSTGKVDTNSLRSMAPAYSDKITGQRLPNTDTEKTLAAIWRDLLPESEPYLDSLFVESGGDSINAMRFNARVQREFGQSIAPRLLLVANLEHLARSLHPQSSDSNQRIEDADNDEIKPQQISEPLMFSTGRQSLYGIIHRPKTNNRESAVLLCTSIGHEYMKLHRLQHTIASLLSADGYNVMRFDYTGMGNSSGDLDSVSVSDWQMDIQAAATELLERCNKQKLIVVGIRLGAPLLLSAKLDNLEHVVAVDPIYDGTEFIAHLEDLHQFALNDTDRYHQRPSQSIPFERFGYTYSAHLLEDIAALTMPLDQIQSNVKISLLQTGCPNDVDGSGRHNQTSVNSLEHSHRFTPKKLTTKHPIWSQFSDAQSLIMDHTMAEQIAVTISEPNH